MGQIGERLADFGIRLIGGEGEEEEAEEDKVGVAVEEEYEEAEDEMREAEEEEYEEQEDKMGEAEEGEYREDESRQSAIGLFTYLRELAKLKGRIKRGDIVKSCV